MIPVVKILFAFPSPYNFKKSPYKHVLYGDTLNLEHVFSSTGLHVLKNSRVYTAVLCVHTAVDLVLFVDFYMRNGSERYTRDDILNRRL